MRVYFPGGSMSVSGEFKAGDPAPTGYIERQEWVAVQQKAGLTQRRCSVCNLLQFPQELTGATCKQCAEVRE